MDRNSKDSLKKYNLSEGLAQDGLKLRNKIYVAESTQLGQGDGFNDDSDDEGENIYFDFVTDIIKGMGLRGFRDANQLF